MAKACTARHSPPPTDSVLLFALWSAPRRRHAFTTMSSPVRACSQIACDPPACAHQSSI
ncbi:unnamed protein product [Periconia digitata]|uniref:Uncharacterized protein n=1 Tax=Periconia digitata TaxID=1303443 RepID=A0A9W4U9Y4_9PLEO|nr:unnamed protein product [Periconia digitata]